MSLREQDLVAAVRRSLAAHADGLPAGEAPPLPAPPPRRAQVRVRAGVALAGVVFLVAGVLAGLRAWDGWSGGEVPVASVPSTLLTTTVAPAPIGTVPQLTAPTSTPVATVPAVTVPVVTVPGLPAGEGVPGGFGARSVSFVTPDLGFAVGASPCAGGYCGAVMRTTDGGRTWRKVGDVPPNLTMIGFVDALHGWAMGPQLYATEDGGVTWRPAVNPNNRPGAQATDIQAAGGVAYLQANASDGVWRLYRATAADPRWVAVPELTEGRGPLGSQSVELGGGAAWLEVVAGNAPAYHAGTDGSAWERRDGVPCPQPEPGPVVAVGDPDTVVVVCRRDDGARSAGAVWVSRDGGRRFEQVADRPLAGPVWDAAVVGATIVVSGPESERSYAGVLTASFDGGRTWSRVATAARGGRFDEVRFLTPQIGVAVEDAFPSVSTVWRTDDGGRTWRPLPM